MNSHLLYDASRLFSASKLSFPPCMIIFKVYLDLELLPIVDLVFVPFRGPVWVGGRVKSAFYQFP